MKQIIVEQTKLDYMVKDFLEPVKDKEGKTNKPKLSKDLFATFLEADPTSKLGDVDFRNASKEELANIQPGKYVRWIIKHYLNPETEVGPEHPMYPRQLKQAQDLFLENLYKVTEDLKKYIRFKNNIEGERNLDKLTPSQLYDKVKDFSLEKTKATKKEKEVAATTYEHPGAETLYRGKNWTVLKITDQGQLGKDAACFYGGYHLGSSKGETNWCTSSPGYNWFERYIKDGPLYVVIPNESAEKRGERSGLPAKRYQFHFPSNQFMDVDDRQINLIDFLNGPGQELKMLFKPEFAKGLTTGGTKLVIESFNSGNIGKFVGLYGLNELFESLPDTLEEMQIQNRDKDKVILEIPESISKFQDLDMIMLDGVIDRIPDSICKLKKLRFMALTNNPNLTDIPECVGNMENLYFFNIQGSPNAKVPQSITSKGVEMGDGMWDLEPANQ